MVGDAAGRTAIKKGILSSTSEAKKKTFPVGIECGRLI